MDNGENLAEETGRLRERVAQLEQQLAALEHTSDSLRLSERHARLFVDHTPAALAMLDNTMRYLLVSRSWLDDYGLTGQDIIGKNHYELFPNISEQWREVHRRVLAGATESKNDDSWQREDGSTQWMNWKMFPWYEANNMIGGVIFFTENVTQRMQDQIALRESEARLREINSDQQRLIDTIREISTPVIPVHDEIIVLPLIGTIDSARSGQVMETLLTGVQQFSAEIVIIDITGVPLVDTAVANHLIQTTRAATLLGAHCVLVGVSAEVAQTLVHLGVNLSTLVTRSNLQSGIDYALARLGKAIVRQNEQETTNALVDSLIARRT